MRNAEWLFCIYVTLFSNRWLVLQAKTFWLCSTNRQRLQAELKRYTANTPGSLVMEKSFNYTAGNIPFKKSVMHTLRKHKNKRVFTFIDEKDIPASLNSATQDDNYSYTVLLACLLQEWGFRWWNRFAKIVLPNVLCTTCQGQHKTAHL